MNQQETLVVGVFEHETEARRFLDSLRSSGFERDDLGLALREGGAPTTNLVQDLIQLGISSEQAEFYYQEMQTGRAVTSIRASNRAQEVRDLLYISGAYDYTSHVINSTESENNATSSNTRKSLLQESPPATSAIAPNSSEEVAPLETDR